MNQGLYGFPPVHLPQKTPTQVAFAVSDHSGENPKNVQYFYPANFKYYDLNNDYDFSKQGFIVPITGLYQFDWSCYSTWGIRAGLYVNGGMITHVSSVVTSLSASYICNKDDLVQMGGAWGNWDLRLIYPALWSHNLFTGVLLREL